MTPYRLIWGGVLSLAIAPATVFGQAAGEAGSAANIVQPFANPTPASPAPDCNCFAIPALTPIELIIDADLGSKTSKSGETFPIRLAKPIIIDGQERLPAGFIGQGEVVHAKKSAGMGASGELVLAARFFTIGDRQLKLRSLRFGVAGKDAINSVVAVNALSVASPLPIGMLGFLVSGQNIVIPNGTVAIAKTSEAFSVPVTAPADKLENTNITSQPVVQDVLNQNRK